MGEYNKEQLIENLKFTSIHVSKVKDLLAKYHCIHRVPFHSATAILTTIILLFLFWAIGLTSVIHTVADRIGTSIVPIEAAVTQTEENTALSEASTVEGTGTEITEDAAVNAEDELFSNISMVVDIFASQSKYSTSGVFKYAIIVALFDTIFIVGLAIGLTHGIFFLYRYIQVERNKDKLKKIVLDIKEELEVLEESFIPQEYWHVPYLQRMLRYVEQDRVDDLRGCLDLIDIEIRHKQIVDALAQDQAIDSVMLMELNSSANLVSSKRSRSSIEEGKSANLSLK